MDINFRSELIDPDSYWMPQADCAVSTKAELASQTLIPRSARMPNVGYLQYVRTGIMPDDESVAYEDQHGTPFRLLSFAPSTDTANQKTTWAGSASYPDWAMLDLLYVPSTLTPFGGSYQASTNLTFYGTFGGATSGRINPNGTVIYTTDVNIPQAGVTRTLPMQAVFQGVKVNQTLTGSSGINASFNGGSDVDASGVAQAVADYIRNNGPLRMPAEICNIPDIASLRARQTIQRATTWFVRSLAVLLRREMCFRFGRSDRSSRKSRQHRLRRVSSPATTCGPKFDCISSSSDISIPARTASTGIQRTSGTDTVVGSLTTDPQNAT